MLVLQTDEAVSTDAQESAVSSAEVQANAVNSWVVSLRSTAHSLGYAEAIQDGDTDRISEFLEHEVGEENVAHNIEAAHYIDTSTGIIISSSADSRVGDSITDIGYATPEALASVNSEQSETASEGDHGSAISQPYNSSVIGGPAVAAGVSVDQPDRALVVVGDTAAFAGNLPKQSESSFLKIVNSEGTVVMSQRQGQILEQNTDAEGINSMAVNKGIGGKSGYMRMQMGEMDMTMGYAPVETADWSVMYHEPASSAFAVKQAVNQNFAIVIGVMGLGLLVAGFIITRMVVPPLTRLTDKAQAIEAGDYDTEIQTTRSDEFGTLFGSFATMRDALRDRIAESEDKEQQAQQAKKEAQAAEKNAQQAKQDAEELAASLQSAAEEYRDGMARAADGDLTVRLDVDTDNDAMADIATSFNEMMGEIEETVARISTFSTEVAEASQRVSAASEQIDDSSNEVAKSVTEISSGMAEQTDSLERASDEVNNLSATVEEIASSAEEVASLSETAATEGLKGQEQSSESIKKMEAIKSQTDTTVEEISALNAEIARVGEVIDLIDEIAEQTNVLALNASIEAARAGDAGDGFAVVANEVKQLSEETQEATEDIEQRIEEVRQKSSDAVAGMQKMQDLVTEGTDTIEESLTSLNEIVDKVEEANGGIQSINQATDQQAESAQEVVSMIDDIAAISKQTSNEADAVAATAEEQSSSSTEVSEDVQALAAQSQQLQEVVSGFTIERDDPAVGEDASAAVVAPTDDD
ncbi:methyl-accepting chemotaxis protein [Halovenus halobia]|uniref:methyl-accepting chemotaxis protein n=1 Tax=Halovenus halobia TaxID=3396622 RepID=UPI003F543C71